MLSLIIIITGFVIAFLIEAKHDKILADKEALISFLLRKNKLPIEDELEEKAEWHTVDWFYLFSIALVVGLIYGGLSYKTPLVMVIIQMLKVLVFNLRINHLLKTDWWHLGDSGFESKFKGKEKLYYAGSLLLFLISTGILVWQN